MNKHVTFELPLICHILLIFAGTGDDTRTWGPPFCGKESVYFLTVNRNKKVEFFFSSKRQKGWITEILSSF